MKIHLGCGKKILPGYVNCDFSPIWGGTPDVCFDLLERWPFEDDSAYEVLAVHVWEHFYEWQHEHLAQEARRVLKPDGMLVLEMPDLVLCCENFLEGKSGNIKPEGGWISKPHKRHWMYGYTGIYGDPDAAGGDPHQMHKSGWWPKKLAKFLHGQGFKSVETGPPQHKGKKVQRDFRCVAWV